MYHRKGPEKHIVHCPKSQLVKELWQEPILSSLYSSTLDCCFQKQEKHLYINYLHHWTNMNFLHLPNLTCNMNFLVITSVFLGAYLNLDCTLLPSSGSLKCFCKWVYLLLDHLMKTNLMPEPNDFEDVCCLQITVKIIITK